MKNRMKSQKGFTLIEVLIAVLLISLVGLMILLEVAYSSKHSMNANVRATAESVARSEIEYVKNLTYNAVVNPPTYSLEPLSNYGLNSDWTVTASFARLDPKGDGLSNDDGLQLITLNVNHLGNAVLTVEAYKPQR
jgi:prepilin-type N-terminal cleavage/methylation domain-containing protein